MNLHDYQRTVMRVAFAEQPADADLTGLEDAKAFGLYRHMLRTRLEGMAKIAFKHSAAALAAGAFEACFARYLATRPPHSPFIRDVVADFAPFARADAELLAAGKPFLLNLLGFEELKWRLSYLAGTHVRVGEELRELDFTGRPVWNFSLRVLPLHYAVHSKPEDPPALEADLLLYRPHGVDEVRWYV
ncbi:MAG TPA: putative DNA-binding domain-containing protein, partial [Polyangiales bacterium]